MTEVFKVIIAGGRDFNDYDLLRDKCDSILSRYQTGSRLDWRSQFEIVSGTAQGADLLGEEYALSCLVGIRRFPADWDNLDAVPCVIRYTRAGKAYNAVAGHNRNKAMAEYADALIAFDTGGSGTRNMIMTMKKLKKLVRVIKC